MERLLSQQGKEDLAWLRSTLGERFRGPFHDQGDDLWAVELIASYGRKVWCLGGTPEKALQRTREEVQSWGRVLRMRFA